MAVILLATVAQAQVVMPIAMGSSGPTPKRLWFEGGGDDANISPAFTAGWDSTTGAGRKKMLSVRGTTSLGGYASAVLRGTTTNFKALARQWISGGLTAQTISGKVRSQIAATENSGGNNIDRIVISLRVVSSDGGTVRGTLLGLGAKGPVNEFSSADYYNRIAIPDSTVNPVTVQAGDRLVFEIGCTNTTVGSGDYGIFLDGTGYGTDGTYLDQTELKPVSWIEFENGLGLQ